MVAMFSIETGHYALAGSTVKIYGMKRVIVEFL
jgi:hypothetical protein